MSKSTEKTSQQTEDFIQLQMVPSVLYCLKTCLPALDLKRTVYFLVNINTSSATSHASAHLHQTLFSIN